MKKKWNNNHVADPPDGYSMSENSIEINLLFDRLINVGVWDNKRKVMLSPLINQIKEVWKKLLRNPGLFRLMTCQNQDGTKWAHFIAVRITKNGYLLQCLMSNDHAAATPLVTRVIDSCRNSPMQMWYKPANGHKAPGFTERMVGMKAMEDLREHLPKGLCQTVEHQYMFARPVSTESSRSQVTVVPVTDNNYSEFIQFLKNSVGDIFIKNEEFDGDDRYLDELDEMYRGVGLFRKRYMYLGYVQGSSTPVASLACYTGGQAMNLSLLERKNVLIIADDLPKARLVDLCGKMVKTATAHYEGVEPGFIPIVTGKLGAEGLRHHGLELCHLYHQHLAVPENSLLVDYHLNLFNLRYEKIKEKMRESAKPRHRKQNVSCQSDLIQKGILLNTEGQTPILHNGS